MRGPPGLQLSLNCSQVYISEIAYPEVRGLLGSCVQLMVVTGILLAYLAGMSFHIFSLDPCSWPLGHLKATEAEVQEKSLELPGVTQPVPEVLGCQTPSLRPGSVGCDSVPEELTKVCSSS